MTSVTVRQAIINGVRVGVRALIGVLVNWVAHRFGIDLPALFQQLMDTLGLPVSFETAVQAVLALTVAGVSAALLAAEKRWPGLTRILTLGFRTEAPSYPSLPPRHPIVTSTESVQ